MSNRTNDVGDAIKRLWPWALAMYVVWIGYVVAMKPPAPPTPVLATVAMTLTTQERESFAALINMNGKLCGRVVEARRRGDSSSYYIECEQRRDSLARIGYDVDLSTGKVR